MSRVADAEAIEQADKQMARIWRVGASGVVVLLSLVACGNKSLNTADLSSRVTADMNKGDSLSAVALTCPDKIDAKIGGFMECQFTATAQGLSNAPNVSGSVKVMLNDKEGKSYNYSGKYSGANVSGEVNSIGGLPASK